MRRRISIRVHESILISKKGIIATRGYLRLLIRSRFSPYPSRSRFRYAEVEQMGPLTGRRNRTHHAEIALHDVPWIVKWHRSHLRVVT